MTEIGRIEKAYRYPVKSMAGERVGKIFVNYAGLLGDRVFGLVDREKHAAGDNFPWFTIRENSQLLLHKASFVERPANERQYPDEESFEVRVETPAGRSGSLRDDDFVKLLRSELKEDFLVRFSEKGMHDARPVSLMGLNTIKGLEEESGVNLDPMRFRMNFYAQWRDETPFFEDELVGKRIQIGERCELLVQKKDPRCTIITVDPTTAESNPQVLKTVAKKHAGCAGVYGVVVREGIVLEGDPIVLVD